VQAAMAVTLFISSFCAILRLLFIVLKCMHSLHRIEKPKASVVILLGVANGERDIRCLSSVGLEGPAISLSDIISG
jgi:hypothetical protein